MNYGIRFINSGPFIGVPALQIDIKSIDIDEASVLLSELPKICEYNGFTQGKRFVFLNAKHGPDRSKMSLKDILELLHNLSKAGFFIISAVCSDKLPTWASSASNHITAYIMGQSKWAGLPVHSVVFKPLRSALADKGEIPDVEFSSYHGATLKFIDASDITMDQLARFLKQSKYVWSVQRFPGSQ